MLLEYYCRLQTSYLLRNTQCLICVSLYAQRNELACVILHAHSQGIFIMFAASDRLQSISFVHHNSSLVY
jgi:hypothetical protein